MKSPLRKTGEVIEKSFVNKNKNARNENKDQEEQKNRRSGNRRPHFFWCLKIL